QLPPGKIDMSSGAEARSLSSEEINFVVSTQTGAVRDCVVRGATNTSIHGVTITITMAVDGTGRVTSHLLEAPAYMLEHGLYDCTTRAVARMKFPATGAGTLVDFPVTLN
ncbi:MAG: hypothetical protein NT062_17135, partial [Proteobacteria bacterium]|nr:hypothetical protein [Pseudomonadota bacterium]